MPNKTSPKATEKREDRFKRVAQGRVRRAVTALRILARCGNRRLYTYTEEQARQLVMAIEAAFIDVAKSYSRPPEPDEQQAFSFDAPYVDPDQRDIFGAPDST